MAGARPQQRASGITGVHVWLIVFVALWLGTTVFLVLMFTNQEQLRQDSLAAQNKVKTMIGTADSTPGARALSGQGGGQQPVLKVALDTIGTLNNRLTGKADDNLAAVETQWTAVIDEIGSAGKVPSPEQIGRGTGAIPALRQMYEWYVVENDTRLKSTQALDEANKALDEAQARTKSLEEDFGTKLTDLQKKVDAISNDKSEFARLKTTEIDDLSKNIAAKKDELTKVAADMKAAADKHEASVARYEQTMAQQGELLAQYRSPGPEGTNELDIARQPIGRVIRALPGDALIHIDMGKLDGVKLGMPFSVYSFDKPVPNDGHGKATIEVTSVGQHTAECRVITPPPADEPILQDDLVGNILLSRNKNKKPRFVVIGEFDSDYDGSPDPGAYDKVVAFINRFGGVVVKDVDATTDYIVRGKKPSAADAAVAKPTEKNPIGPTQARRAERDATFYDRCIRQGQALGIPRLSQDQFFSFVGLELGRGADERLSP